MAAFIGIAILIALYLAPRLAAAMRRFERRFAMDLVTPPFGY